MTPRQLRRAAEHKTRKDAYKAQRDAQTNSAAPTLELTGSPEQSAPAATPAPDHTHPQTGPRTSEGKAVSSQNARTHGLCSKNVPSADYDALSLSLEREHCPATPTESILVTCMADAYCQLERVRRYEKTLLAEGAAYDDPRRKLAHRYATTYERTFHRNLRLLRELQKERLAQVPDAAARPDFVSQKAAVSRAPRPFVSQSAPLSPFSIAAASGKTFDLDSLAA